MANEDMSFAFDPMRPTSQATAGGAQLQRADVQSGRGVGLQLGESVAVPAKEDATLALLFKAGSDILEGQMNRIAVEKYVSGMQRAMQGEAITDIAQNQPWYSKLFGVADEVEGARAFYSNTRAAENVAAMEDAMPDLRKMGPDEARSYFTEQVSKSLTGDKITDASILQAMTRSYPAVMRRQAKEHYGYKQELAVSAQAASFHAESKVLNGLGASLDDGYTTQDEYNQRALAAVRSFQPVQGQDLDNYRTGMAANLKGAAERGELHTVNALRATGFFEVLTPDQRNAVEGSVNSAEARVKAKYSYDWVDTLTDLSVRAGRPPEGTTPKQLMEEAKAINEKYMRRTGSSQGILSPAEIEGIGKGSSFAIANAFDENAKRIAANAEKAQTAFEKQQAEKEKTNTIITRASRGDLYLVAGTPGYSQDLINSTITKAYHGLNDPARRVGVLSANYDKGKYVVKTLADELDGHVNQAVVSAKGEFNPGVMGVYGEWLSMHQKNPDLAAAYYPLNGPRLLKFHNSVGAGVPESGAFQQAFVNDIARKPVDKDVLKATTAAVASEFNSVLPGWLGGRKLRPEAIDAVANYLGNGAEQWNWATNDPQLAARTTLNKARAEKRIQLIGSHGWVNPPGIKNTMESYLTRSGAQGQVALGVDTVDDAFDMAVEERLLDVMPEKASRVVITHLGEVDGAPQLHLFALDSEGKNYQARLNGNQVFSLYHKARDKKTSLKGEGLLTQHGVLTPTSKPRTQPLPSGPKNVLEDGVFAPLFK